MNIIKRVALIVMVFVVLMVIISMFLPSSFQMERSIIINADKEQVFRQVNELRNWKNWAPWALKDGAIYNIDDAFSLNSHGVGATFRWDSENNEIGEGSMEIIESTPHSYIKNKVIFGFMESISEWKITTVDDGIGVVWKMNVEFGFNPVTKFFGLFMENQVAPDYELGLKRLKDYAEGLPKINSVKVKIDQLKEDLWLLSIRDTINPMEMNNVHGKIYATIDQYLTELGISENTAPLVIYHSWTNSVCDIEVGIPVQDSTILARNEMKLIRIKSTYLVSAIHYGPYERLIETYDGINEWMRKNKVSVTGPNWEVYLVDPAIESNPEKWEVGVYFPIEKPNK